MFDFDFNIDIPEIDIEFTIPMADNGFKNRYTGQWNPSMETPF